MISNKSFPVSDKIKRQSRLRFPLLENRTLISNELINNNASFSQSSKNKSKKSKKKKPSASQTHAITGEGSGRPVSEHKQAFEKVCEIVGWDSKALGETDKGQVAQTVGILKKAGYTLDDLVRFGSEVWVRDWRWEKHKQYPTLTQLRQEIGKLRSKGFQPGRTTKAFVFDDPDEPEYLKLAKQGIGPRQ